MRAAQDSDRSIMSWGRWTQEILARARNLAPLQVDVTIPLSWDLRHTKDRCTYPWLVERGVVDTGVTPYLVVSWPALLNALPHFLAESDVPMLSAVYRARRHIAADDAVLATLLELLGDGLRTAAKAPRSGDPSFAASLGAHASLAAQNPASVRRWAVAVQRALRAIAPDRLQTVEGALVLDPASVVNEFARKHLKPVAAPQKTQIEDSTLNQELLWLLSALPPDGVGAVGNALVVSWEDYYQSYLDLGVKRSLYGRAGATSSDEMRQTLSSALPNRVFMNPLSPHDLIVAAGFDPANGRYTIFSLGRLRALISARRNVAALPPRVRAARVARAARVRLSYEYAGMAVNAIRRKGINYFTTPYEVYGTPKVYNEENYYSLAHLIAAGCPEDFCRWLSGVDRALTQATYDAQRRKATTAQRIEDLRAAASGGVGVFTAAEDEVIATHLDCREHGPLTPADIDAIVSKLPGRTAAGVRRRVRVLIKTRAKLVGWAMFRQSGWWPGGQLAQSIYAEGRKRG